MKINIHPIPLSGVHSYVIEADGVILIDAGIPKTFPSLERQLACIPIKLADIQLLVITHAHFDHVGNALEIKASTRAPILVHRDDQEALETGRGPIPPGITPWGRTLSALGSIFEPAIIAPKVNPDLIVDDTGFDLREYGVPGEIIHTPGHTMGSISVLLENSAAIVGDLAMSGFPKRRKPGIPIFAESLEHVLASWRELIERGAEMIYPAHGKPFPVDYLRRELVKFGQ